MIAGGDINKIAGDAKKYFCGGALKKNFDPAKDGDAQCKAAVDSELTSAYTEITDPRQRANLERYLQIWYGQPLFECILGTGIFGPSGLNKDTGPKGMACMAEFSAADPKRKLDVSGWGLEISSAPKQLKAFNEYVAWAVSMVKQDVTCPTKPKPSQMPLPPAGGDAGEKAAWSIVASLLETLTGKEKDAILLQAMRLFFQAMEQAKVPQIEDETAAKKAADAIANQIIDWANDVEPGTEEKGLLSTYVQEVEPADKNYNIVFETFPPELLNPEALGMTAAIVNDSKVQGELYRLFYEALMSFRAQKGQGEDLKAIAAKLAAAIKGAEIKADSARGVTARLAQLSASAGLDKAGALEKVALSPRTLGNVPQVLRDRVIGYAGLEDRVYLEQALLDFWNQDVGATKNTAGLTYGKVYEGLDAAGQDKVANALADAFIAYAPDNFVARANMIALTRVTKLDADGSVETNLPSRLLFKDFAATWKNIGFHRHLRDLFDQYKGQAADAKLQLTDRDIAKELARQTKLALARPEDFASHQDDVPLEASSEKMASDASLKQWLGMQAGGFDKDGNLKPLTLPAAAKPSSSWPKGLKADANLAGTVAGNGEDKPTGGGSLEANIRYEHPVSKSWKFGGMLGMNGYFTPAYLDASSALMEFAMNGQDQGLAFKAFLLAMWKMTEGWSAEMNLGFVAPNDSMGTMLGANAVFGYKSDAWAFNLHVAGGTPFNVNLLAPTQFEFDGKIGSGEIGVHGEVSLSKTSGTKISTDVAYRGTPDGKEVASEDGKKYDVHQVAFAAKIKSNLPLNKEHSFPAEASTTVVNTTADESSTAVTTKASLSQKYMINEETYYTTILSMEHNWNSTVIVYPEPGIGDDPQKFSKNTVKVCVNPKFGFWKIFNAGVKACVVDNLDNNAVGGEGTLSIGIESPDEE